MSASFRSYRNHQTLSYDRGVLTLTYMNRQVVHINREGIIHLTGFVEVLAQSPAYTRARLSMNDVLVFVGLEVGKDFVVRHVGGVASDVDGRVYDMAVDDDTRGRRVEIPSMCCKDRIRALKCWRRGQAIVVRSAARASEMAIRTSS